ncbi:MAG: helix-turn-helix domain-containing protein [Bacteroides sp.]|nr:helix-turn-helix domain-containing protein [Bacteroides sp.]
MSIEERLERIEALLSIGVKEVLNVREAAAMLGISADRVRHLVSDKVLPHYRNAAGRVTFLRSELTDWCLATRVPTQKEIESQAATYVVLKQRQKNRQ